MARNLILNSLYNSKQIKDPVKYPSNNIIKHIPTFNILIATIGRDTLENLVNSLVDQLTENDCLTIVFDNNTIREIKNMENLKCKVIINNENSKLGYWGHGIRNKYASLLDKRDFILHADDDDIYFPNSFDRLRKECFNTYTIYIAKMLKNNGIIIPSNKAEIVTSNIGTPCGIIPYEYNINGNWGYFYGGDGQFYIDIIKKFGRMVRLETIIYNCGNTSHNNIIYDRFYKTIQS
jgi:hypothetical protein